MSEIRTLLNGIREWVHATIKKEAPQPDLSVNDPNDPAYVQNRTHWEERETQVLVSEYTFTAEQQNAGDGFWIYPVTTTSAAKALPEVGSQIRVVYDGESYTVPVLEDLDEGVVCGFHAGNKGGLYPPGKSDTGEPFYLRWSINADNTIESFTIFSNSADEHTVYCEIPGEVHPLDLKYLPDSVKTFTVHITYDEETDTYGADKSFEEIKAAYEAGQVVQADSHGWLLPLTQIDDMAAYCRLAYDRGGETIALGVYKLCEDGVVWYDELEPAQAVQSVNGQTGAVELTAEDVGAMAAKNPVATGSFSMGRASGTTVGSYSHAEGSITIASGAYSHAEGYYTRATNTSSHVEGYKANSDGYGSHAEGVGTTATGRAQHVEGEYNIRDGTGATPARDTYLHIAGNGTSMYTRSNAHTLDWSGNAWFAGDIYVGSTSGTNRDDGSKKLATEEKVAEMVAAGGGGDSSLGISGATVGQTVKITGVDDEGKPTAWEAVDVVTPDMFKLVNIATYTLSEMEFPTNIPIDLGQYNEIYAVFQGVTTEAGGQISATPYPGADYNSMYYLSASFGSIASTHPYGDTARFHFKKITKAGYAFDANAATTDYLFVGVSSVYGIDAATEKQNVGLIESPHHASWPYPYWLKLSVAEGETVTGGTLVVLGRRLA